MTTLTSALADVLTDQLAELAEIVDANESAAHQTSHGADESHAGHERDARVQELAELLAAAAERVQSGTAGDAAVRGELAVRVDALNAGTVSPR